MSREHSQEFGSISLLACCPSCRQVDFHCARCGGEAALTVPAVPWTGEAVCPVCDFHLAITVTGWLNPDEEPEMPPLAGDLASFSETLIGLERSFNLHPASRGPAEGPLTPCPADAMRFTWRRWSTSNGAWVRMVMSQFAHPLPSAAQVAQTYRQLYGGNQPRRHRGAFAYSNEEINRLAEAMHQPIETPSTK